MEPDVPGLQPQTAAHPAAGRAGRLNPVTRELIDVVRAQGVAGARVLDIGAGVGAVHVAMLEAMCRGDAAEAERLRRAGLRSARESVEKYQRYIL